MNLIFTQLPYERVRSSSHRPGCGGGLGVHGVGWFHFAAFHALGGAGDLSAGRAGQSGDGRSRAAGAVRCAAIAGVAHRPAGSAAAFTAGRAVGVLPVSAGRLHRRHFHLRFGLFPRGRGHGAGAAGYAVPRVSGGDVHGDARGRCLQLHAVVGSHGHGVVLPGDFPAPHGGNPQRRLCVSAAGASGGHRPAVVFRGDDAGRHCQPDVRGDAPRALESGLGQRGLRSGGHRLWCQGWPGSFAHLAARGAPGCAFAGFGLDERGDAQDRALWPAAGELRSAACAAVVVGCAAAGARAVRRLVRCAVRRGADRYEAASGLFVHREYRHCLRRSWPGAGVSRGRVGGVCGAGARRHAVPPAQPRLFQEPAVPDHRLSAPCHPPAQSGKTRRLVAHHALGGLDGLDRHAGDCRAAAAQRLCRRVAAVAVVSVHAADSRAVFQSAHPAGCGHAGADGGAGGLCHGEVLWRDFSRPRTRAATGTSARCRLAGAHRAAVVGRGLCAAGPDPDLGAAGHRPGQPDVAGQAVGASG